VPGYTAKHGASVIIYLAIFKTPRYNVISHMIVMKCGPIAFTSYITEKCFWEEVRVVLY